MTNEKKTNKETEADKNPVAAIREQFYEIQKSIKPSREFFEKFYEDSKAKE